MEGEPKIPNDVEDSEQINEAGFFKIEFNPDGTLKEVKRVEKGHTDTSVPDIEIDLPIVSPEITPEPTVNPADEFADMPVENPAIRMPVLTEEDLKAFSEKKEQEKAPVPEPIVPQISEVPPTENNFDVEFGGSEEAAPLPKEEIDQLLGAQSVEEFMKICDQLQAENKSINVKEEHYSGEYIKRTLELAQNSITSGKKLQHAAKYLGSLPKSELRDKIEGLLNVKGLMETSQALDSAYEQAA